MREPVHIAAAFCSLAGGGLGTAGGHVELESWFTIGDGYAAFVVAGALDIAVRDELTAALTDAAERTESTLIVDLSRVTVLAAAGFHCLEGVADQLSRRGALLYLVCAQGRPARRILAILDDRQRWPLYSDVPAAVESVLAAARR
jgi:anti-anti-sigma factor